MTCRTFVILDGLQDPLLAQRLSRRWSRCGFRNAVDVAGQSAWLAPDPPEGEGRGSTDHLAQADMDRAASIARMFGVELRDRSGAAFRHDNDLPELRRRMIREYRHRLVVGLMFGLPVVVLHYVGPYFAVTGGAHPMIVPWIFEMLLAGWACVAAGWPILWQAALSVAYLRPSADLLTGAVLVASYAPSAVGVILTPFVDGPIFETAVGDAPMFHATALALWIAVAQRWLAHRFADRLSGRAVWMLRGFGRVVFVWLILMAVLWPLIGWRWAVAFGMLLPPALSLGAINRWSPGWTTALPVFGFSVLMLLGPGALSLDAEGVQVEIAAGFGVIMTFTFAAGWALLRTIDGAQEKTPGRSAGQG